VCAFAPLCALHANMLSGCARRNCASTTYPNLEANDLYSFLKYSHWILLRKLKPDFIPIATPIKRHRASAIALLITARSVRMNSLRHQIQGRGGAPTKRSTTCLGRNTAESDTTSPHHQRVHYCPAIVSPQQQGALACARVYGDTLTLYKHEGAQARAPELTHRNHCLHARMHMHVRTVHTSLYFQATQAHLRTPAHMNDARKNKHQQTYTLPARTHTTG
jgi:hypothetical protein